MEKQTIYLAAGVVGVALVAAYLIKKAANSLTDAGGVAGVAAAAGGAAVDAVTGAATGTVMAIGEQFGIPATSKTQCEIDMANGDTWAASFSCPLPTFAKYVANGFKAPGTMDSTAAKTDTYTPVNGWKSHGAR